MSKIWNKLRDSISDTSDRQLMLSVNAPYFELDPDTYKIALNVDKLFVSITNPANTHKYKGIMYLSTRL
jgi:hypothetical protein